MLAVHCKTGEALELASPLRNYVAEQYGAQASDAGDDIEAIASLRREIVQQIGGLPALRDKLIK